MKQRRVSISLRLTTWFGIIFLLGWLLFGVAMWLNLKKTLTGERHMTLARRVDRFQELLLKNQNEDESARDQDFKDFAHATGNGLVEVFHPDGRRAYPSPSSAASAFPWPAASSGNAEQFVHVESAGQPYWVLARPFSVDGHPLFLFVAAPEAGNLLLLDTFWKGVLASVPLLLLVSSAAGYWVSRRALRPVDQITATARSISIRNLSERLPVTNTGDELQRLAETCNAMLARFESAVNQIKQFTADASHELRGPLSFTRTVAEVALRNPDADAESRKAFEDILQESIAAAKLLEEMLALARADSEHLGTVLEPVNLTEVVVDACENARTLSNEKNLTLLVSYSSELSINVLGDFWSLRRLLWILLDNAVKYTNAPGQIDVALSTDTGRATLVVRDSGIGIAQADIPRIFDRFYRADSSRSQVDGNGLGLAIAKWIADMHNADLSVISEERKGSSFRLVFPLFEE